MKSSLPLYSRLLFTAGISFTLLSPLGADTITLTNPDETISGNVLGLSDGFLHIRKNNTDLNVPLSRLRSFSIEQKLAEGAEKMRALGLRLEFADPGFTLNYSTFELGVEGAVVEIFNKDKAVFSALRKEGLDLSNREYAEIIGRMNSQSLENYREVKTEERIINSRTMIVREVTGTFRGSGYRYIQYFFTHNHENYMYLAWTLDSLFERNRTLFERIIQSLRFEII